MSKLRKILAEQNSLVGAATIDLEELLEEIEDMVIKLNSIKEDL